MAGRLIVFKNDETPIEGDAVAKGYEKQIRLDGVEYTTDASPHMGGTAVLHLRPIILRLPFGPWVAEFQQRMWQGHTLGNVEIAEVEQEKVDAATKQLKVIRKVTLKEASIESMTHHWNGIDAQVGMRLVFDSIVFASKDKLAEYNTYD